MVNLIKHLPINHALLLLFSILLNFQMFCVVCRSTDNTCKTIALNVCNCRHTIHQFTTVIIQCKYMFSYKRDFAKSYMLGAFLVYIDSYSPHCMEV